MATKDKPSYAKQWRKGNKERHRLEIFTMEYLRYKHPAIRAEIELLFEAINIKYPTKRNLAITPEFQVWKGEIAQTSAAQETATVTTTAVMPSAAQETATVTTTAVMPSAAQETATVTTAAVMPSAAQETATVTTAAVMPSAVQETATVTTTVMGSDLELGATAIADNGDPWMGTLLDTNTEIG